MERDLTKAQSQRSGQYKTCLEAITGGVNLGNGVADVMNVLVGG